MPKLCRWEFEPAVVDSSDKALNQRGSSAHAHIGGFTLATSTFVLSILDVYYRHNPQALRFHYCYEPIRLLITYMKKLLVSDWLRAVQLRVTPVQKV